MSLHETIIAKFQECFGEAPAHVVRAPGRVNLLGEHVDYNDGFVLPIAIDREVWLAFSPSDTDQTTLRAVDMSENASFTLQTLPAKTDTSGRDLPVWALYPAGVMWALKEAGLATPAHKRRLYLECAAGLRVELFRSSGNGICSRLANAGWMETSAHGARPAGSKSGKSICGRQLRYYGSVCQRLRRKGSPSPPRLSFAGMAYPAAAE